LSPTPGPPIGLGGGAGWVERGWRLLPGHGHGPPARGHLTAIPLLGRQGAVAIIRGRAGFAPLDGGPITPEAIAPWIRPWGTGGALDAPRWGTAQTWIAPQGFIEAWRFGPGSEAVRSPSRSVGVPATLDIMRGFPGSGTRRLALRRGVPIGWIPGRFSCGRLQGHEAHEEEGDGPK